MSKGGIIAFLGFLVVLMPFLGIPESIKTVAVVSAGAAIIFLGVLVREERRWLMRAISGGHESDAYTENAVPTAERSLYEKASHPSA